MLTRFFSTRKVEGTKCIESVVGVLLELVNQVFDLSDLVLALCRIQLFFDF